MSLGAGTRRRVLATTAAALVFGSVNAAGWASADVYADADDPVRGEYAVVTFRVPNESESGSPTTKLTVHMPQLDDVAVRATHGWTTSVEREPAGEAVRSISWTASSGSGIPADHFESFEVYVSLPDAETVTFPVTQAYADGTTVKWDQPPSVDGSEPVNPAPRLALLPAIRGALAGSSGVADAEPVVPSGSSGRALGPDNVARALGGAALLLAAMGVGITMVRRG